MKIKSKKEASAPFLLFIGVLYQDHFSVLSTSSHQYTPVHTFQIDEEALQIGILMFLITLWTDYFVGLLSLRLYSCLSHETNSLLKSTLPQNHILPPNTHSLSHNQFLLFHFQNPYN